MFIRLVVTLYIFSGLVEVCAQAPSIQFAAYWEMGDVRKYEITKTDRQFKNDEVEQNTSNTYKSTFSVIDSTDSTYTIDWTYDNQIFNQSIPPSFREEFDEYRTMHIRYETDQLGVFKGIVNFDEIAEMMTGLFDKLPVLLSNDSINVGSTMYRLKQILTSREGIENLVMKELEYFHWPLGLEYAILDTMKWEEYLPNMLGGRPIKANGQMYFTEVIPENHSVKFTTRLDLDEQDSRDMMTETINQAMLNQVFSSDSARKAKLSELYSFFGQMDISIRDSNHFEYDYFNGWPIDIRVKRQYDIDHPAGSALKIEELRIRQIQ